MKENITAADLEGVLEFAYQEEYFGKWAQGKISAADIAEAYLQTKDSTMYKYVLLGVDACEAFSELSIEDFCDATEEMNVGSWELVKTADQAYISECIREYGDYSYLNESEYLAIRHLVYGDTLTYQDIQKMDGFIVDFSGIENPESHPSFFISNGIIYPS